jgi:hypothetical protein
VNGVLTLFVPIRLRSPQNLREHWGGRASRVRKQRDATAAAVYVADARHATFRQLRAAAATGTTLEVTFEGHVPRLMDSDNYIGACKASRDALAQLLGISDGPEAGHVWTYKPQLREPMKILQGLYITVAAR